MYDASCIRSILYYFSLMSVCAAPTYSHQSFNGSSYYVDVDVFQTLILFILIDVINKQT
jgi:hypothetical protein